MCQWVINSSIACCQQMGSVIIFFLIWSSALSFCRKQNRKGNPCEPCQHPRVPPDSGRGSEGLCCTSAKLLKCKGHSTLPWDSSVSITYTDKAEESFSLRQMAGGLRNKNVKKKKKLEALFRNGCSGLEAHRQAGHIIKVHPALCLAGCLYGPQCWICCLAYLSWSLSALFIEETHFLWEILPLNTPVSLLSQCPGLWLPAVPK